MASILPKKLAMGSLAGMFVAYLGWQLLISKVFATQSDLTAMAATVKQEAAQNYMNRSELQPAFIRLEEKLDKMNEKITDMRITLGAIRRYEKTK